MDKKNNGTIYVISAASGAGKTSLINKLITELPDLQVSISYTTRLPRVGEVDGVHYYFVSIDRFMQLKEEGVFIESAEVFGHFYGTSIKWLTEKSKAGIDIILELDWQGARSIRNEMSEIVDIFILPPSLEALKDRLKNRNQDSEEVIANRIAKAQRENSHYNEYKYLVINDNFDDALLQLKAIILSQRSLLEHVEEKYKDDIKNLVT